jgi:hypothetical protein
MTAYTIIRALERRGVERGTIMTWQSRLFSRHHQAWLETAVVIAVLVLVFLFATVAVGSAQEAGAVAQAPPGAAMNGMMAKCEARHTVQAADIKALAKTVAEARATRDVALLHAALDAVAVHLVRMETHVASCTAKMNGTAPTPGKAPAVEPAQPHVH